MRVTVDFDPGTPPQEIERTLIALARVLNPSARPASPWLTIAVPRGADAVSSLCSSEKVVAIRYLARPLPAYRDAPVTGIITTVG